MKFYITISIILFFNLTLFSQENKDVKVCKYKYKDFKALSINDTSDAVIDLFLSKKESALYNRMSLLPVSLVLVAVPTPMQFVGLGSFAISGPLFLSGGYTLIRYRKRKLNHVLIEYKNSRELPKWVRKKANNLLKEYQLQQMSY